MKLLLTAILLFPANLLAQGTYQPMVDIAGLNSGDGFNNLLLISIALAGTLAVIKIVLAGVKWMLSDIATNKQSAKADIRGSLVGLIIVISSVLVLTIINPELTNVELQFDPVEVPEYTPPASSRERNLNEMFGQSDELTLVSVENEEACAGFWFGDGNCVLVNENRGGGGNSGGSPVDYTPSGSAAADSFYESGGGRLSLPPTPGFVTAQDGDYGGYTQEYRLGSSLHGKVIDWARPFATEGQGRGRIIIGLDNSVLVQPFRTTSNPQLGGDINLAEVPGQEGVSRRIWISETPGGEAVADPRCDREGGSTRAQISWSQGENRLRCELNTDTNYYLNIQQIYGCTRGEDCAFFRTMATNANEIGDPGASWDNPVGGQTQSDPISCIETSTQKCGAEINWASTGPQLTGGLRGTSEVISWPFTTTIDSTYNGLVSVSETASFGDVSRKVWFSTEPNGPAISPDCSSEGATTRTFYWSQSSSPPRGYSCQLETSRQYFMNVTNTAGCPAGSTCGFIRNFSS